MFPIFNSLQTLQAKVSIENVNEANINTAIALELSTNAYIVQHILYKSDTEISILYARSNPPTNTNGYDFFYQSEQKIRIVNGTLIDITNAITTEETNNYILVSHSYNSNGSECILLFYKQNALP